MTPAANDGKKHLFVFRFMNEIYNDPEWRVVFSQEEAETQLMEMIAGDPAGNWRIEVQPAFITELDLSKLTAQFMGARTSTRKSKAARENGKKGGRPRRIPTDRKEGVPAIGE